METFIAVLIFAAFFTLIMSIGYERERTPTGIGAGFFLIFVPLMALSFLIPAQGPLYYGVAWFDIFLIALAISLFIAASTPTSYYKLRRKTHGRSLSSARAKETYSESDSVRGFSIFFWILALLLIATFIFR
jgi:hypothetical protein